MTEQPLVQTRAMVVGYHSKPLLPPLDWAIGSGERWAVLGPNGGGKTTCVRSLLGLLPLVSGGVEWAPSCRKSYVSQRTNDIRNFPLTVEGYVAGGIDRGRSYLNPVFARSSTERSAIHHALECTQMKSLASARISELSEGQFQRARIARALGSKPTLVVLDEPTTGLDVQRQNELFGLLDDMVSQGIATLTVSHRLSAITESATHVLLVDKTSQTVIAGEAKAVLEDPRWTQTFGDHFRLTRDVS